MRGREEKLIRRGDESVCDGWREGGKLMTTTTRSHAGALYHFIRLSSLGGRFDRVMKQRLSFS